jgi:hypothetical protein
MDKAQKELINTYFRKREIADKQSSLNYELYEIIYAINNNIYIDTSILSELDVINILKNNPQLIAKFNLKRMGGYSIGKILRFQPQLVDRFDLSKLSGEIVGELLIYQPQLIDKFDLQNVSYSPFISEAIIENPKLIDNFDLSKLNSGGIHAILRSQPQLIGKFDLQRLRGWNIGELLMTQPRLIDAEGLNGSKFDLNKLPKDGFSVNILLRKHPQLAKYFNS